MNDSLETSENLYNIYIEAWVKNFKGQRSNTSTRLTPDVQIACNTVVEFKQKLWDHFSSNIRGKAVIPADLGVPCTLEPDGIRIDNIDRFISFQKNNRPVLLNQSFTTRTMHTLSCHDIRETTPVEMVIYAYSDSINSSAQWDRFKTDCILPARIDRAGAASEESVVEIQNRLINRWRGESFDILHPVLKILFRHLFLRIDQLETLGERHCSTTIA